MRGLRIEKLAASTPGGSLDLTGSAAWQPALSWDVDARLASFDPGYFVPGWEGKLSGTLASRGKQLPPPAGTAERTPSPSRTASRGEASGSKAAKVSSSMIVRS